ncbi:hypothetical protein MKW94_022784 [Papaver nudicaule]|uniref:Dynein light chain n=1 Tax=Papaver nudicaule TaxID=74823 RepID=A0AA42AWJ0_PAPNU|nr:hypothetical protein [Papaver nudicaule]
MGLNLLSQTRITLSQVKPFVPDYLGFDQEIHDRIKTHLLMEFDSSYGPAWHCIVGTSFGSYVTHSLGGFIYFSISKVYVLLFRTAVEPLEK